MAIFLRLSFIPANSLSSLNPPAFSEISRSALFPWYLACLFNVTGQISAAFMKGSITRYHGRAKPSPLLMVARALGIRTTNSVAESRRWHRHGDIAHARSILTRGGEDMGAEVFARASAYSG